MVMAMASDTNAMGHKQKLMNNENFQSELGKCTWGSYIPKAAYTSL